MLDGKPQATPANLKCELNIDHHLDPVPTGAFCRMNDAVFELGESAIIPIGLVCLEYSGDLSRANTGMTRIPIADST